jgi:hypothetical protein
VTNQKSASWIGNEAKKMRAGKPCATHEELMRKAASLGFDPAEFANL